MQINYWQCPYGGSENYDARLPEDGDEIRIYGCVHPKNNENICPLENKFAEDTDDCKLLDQQLKAEVISD